MVVALTAIFQQPKDALAGYLLELSPGPALIEEFASVNLTKEVILFCAETGFALAAEDGYDAIAAWTHEKLVKLNTFLEASLKRSGNILPFHFGIVP